MSLEEVALELTTDASRSTELPHEIPSGIANGDVRREGELSPPRTSPRVLVVPSSYFAADRTVGGGERYALEYARALGRLTPTTLALFDTRESEEVRDGVLTRTFRVTSTHNSLVFPLARESYAALREFDVLHLMIFPTPLSDLLTVLGKLRGQTVVLTDVGGGIRSVSTYLQRLNRRLGLNRLADGLALLSQHSAGQFVDWRQPQVLLYGGASLPSLDSPAPEAEPYALFVGRLLPHKGVLELIEAVDADTPLKIVGRPYDMAYLERLRHAAEGKKVSFYLSADDAEVEGHYLGARVVLQPSLPVHAGARDTSELLGLVALEGMAAGKPVVVTRAGSLPELVRDGIEGFVVNPGDPDELGDRIRRLMADPGLASRMGLAGRRRVGESFTWDRVAERGLRFYHDLRQRRSDLVGSR